MQKQVNWIPPAGITLRGKRFYETRRSKSGLAPARHQLCFSAYALSREIIGLYRPFLEPLGITYTQYITLMVMWEERVVSMKHLGDGCSWIPAP